MLMLRHYENIDKKEDGYYYKCSEIVDADDENGSNYSSSMIGNIYERNKTYKESDDYIINMLKSIRSDIDDLVNRYKNNYESSYFEEKNND